MGGLQIKLKIIVALVLTSTELGVLAGYLKKYRIPPITNYIIANGLCNIPHFDPLAFDDNSEDNQSYVSCAKITPLVYFEKTGNKVFAVMNNTNVSSSIECCLSNVYEDECEVFEGNSNKIEIKDSVIQITCVRGKRVIYEDVYASILDEAKTLNKSDGYNVLMILIDNLSLPNFLKKFKKLHTFLSDNNYVNIKAYNQVGRNIYQNIVPLLTGHSHRFGRLKYGNPKNKFFDDYQFIWKDFRMHNYITAFLCDFNKGFKGFSKPPTSYYFRDYLVNLDRIYQNCTLKAERILNLITDFVTIYKDTNFFSFFQLNSYSLRDEDLQSTFRRIHESQNKTVIFLMSINEHPVLQEKRNFYKWFEKRTPLNFVFVPNDFRNRHQERYQNLLENSKKLISPYDIYMSLIEILEISNSDYKPNSRNARSCQNCGSIFGKMSDSRTCREAGIDPFWCTCINSRYEFFNPTNESGSYFLDV